MRPILISVLAAALTPLAAYAHITVWPRQSDLGAREKYIVRTPNEKKVSTVRVEGVFPPEVRVTQIEQMAGWTIDIRRNAAGAIAGATWTGDLPPDQFAEFGLLVVNPKAGTELVWTFTQVYADGSRIEWAGPPSSSTPAPRVQLRAAAETAR